MYRRVVLPLLVFGYCPFVAASVVTLGFAENQFSMEFVTIGNPGNEADAPRHESALPLGAVPYEFQIGKYEVSRDMILKANGSAALDGTGGDLRIMVEPTNDIFSDVQQPATELSWEAAARFVNWLNTSSGYHPAYRFLAQPGGPGYNPNFPVEDRVLLWEEDDAGFSADNPMRNTLARFVLPSLDEWHKAAYHDSSAGTAGIYFDYPTGSDAIPIPVDRGTEPGTVVYGQPIPQGPAPIKEAGGLSSYGTMAQGGNAWEHQESYPRTGTGGTWMRGGAWHGDRPDPVIFSSTFISGGRSIAGFRVAMILSSQIGDFSQDGLISSADIDLLTAKIASMTFDTLFDLNEDGLVNDLDLAFWVEDIADTHFGDADLNGTVDFDDFVLLADSFNLESGWADGDFDGSGKTDFDDFVVLTNNFGLGQARASSVPEPHPCYQLSLAFIITMGVLRKLG